MVQYVTEDKTEEAFNELLNIAEGLVRNLGLHYQVSKLAAGDCAQGMCRTYDIEVWIPSMGIYKEVSSVSNSRDYQAREIIQWCEIGDLLITIFTRSLTTS